MWILRVKPDSGGIAVTHQEYLSGLYGKYRKHFQVQSDIQLLGHKIDLSAKYSDICGRTFLTKKDVIDRFENHEHCYVKSYPSIAEEDVRTFTDFLIKAVGEFVNPGNDHMCTYMTGVLVGGGITPEAAKIIKKFSYSKVYAFYLKGWCDIRLVAVDLRSKAIITNKAGDKVKKVYQITP